MPMYNSMIVWILILALLYKIANSQRSFALKSADIDDIGFRMQTEKVPMFLAILTFAYIIFWVGIRGEVADTLTYISGFREMGTNLSDIPSFWNLDNKAPGFDTYKLLFKKFISSDYHAWLMSIAIFSGIPLIIILQKYSCDFFYSSLLFIITINFFWMLNGMRQFLAAAIMFLFAKWIVERKTWQFMLVILFASTIHFTALIMIPAYFFVTEKPFGKKMLILCLITVFCAIFIDQLIPVAEDALEGTNYTGFSAQFAEDDGVNPLRVLVMTIPPAIAFFARKTIYEDNNQFVNLCVNMSVVCAAVYFIAMFTSGVLIGRMPLYFELYNLLLIPYLFKKCFTYKSSVFMYICGTLGYFVFYWLQMRGSYYCSDITGYL